MYDNLELSLSTEREAYSPGEPIAMIFAVRNSGSAPRTFSFSSGQRYDFAVIRDGSEIWRWSAGRMFTQILGGMTLAPGETVIYSETWPQVDNNGQNVKPGEYRITANLTTGTPAERASMFAEARVLIQKVVQ